MGERIEIDLSGIPNAPGTAPAPPNPRMRGQGATARTLKLDAESEGLFQKWYAGQARVLDLDPDPDAPEHQYDYRAAWLAGEGPDEKGHWPSGFKLPGHPNRFVEGRDTMMEGVPEGALDLSKIPEAPPTLGVPELRQAPEPGAWERFTNIFREEPAKLAAKAQNAFAFSEALNIPLSEAYRYHDEIAKSWGGKDMPTTPELVGGLATFPVVAGLMANPASAILGLATFLAIAEAESAAVSWTKGEPYRVFQNRGLADFLPEDASQLTKDLVELIDFIGKGLAAKGVFRKSPRAIEAVTRKIVTEHNLPRKLYIDPMDLKRELQVGGVLGADEMSIVRGLGLKSAEYRRAVSEGLHIEVPSERFSIITDRPWFARVKKLLKLDPAQPIVVEHKPTFRFGEGETRGAVREPQAPQAPGTRPAPRERPGLPAPGEEGIPPEQPTPEMAARTARLARALEGEEFQGLTRTAREEAAAAVGPEEFYEILSDDLRATLDKSLRGKPPGLAEMDEFHGQLEQLREETARVWAPAVLKEPPVAPEPSAPAVPIEAPQPAAKELTQLSEKELVSEAEELDRIIYSPGRTAEKDLPLIIRREDIENELVRRGSAVAKGIAPVEPPAAPGAPVTAKGEPEVTKTGKPLAVAWEAPVAHWRERQMSKGRWEAKFADRYRGLIEAELKPEIEAAEPPLTLKSESMEYGALRTDYSRVGSTWPEWASDRGWTRKRVLRALDKLLAGEKMGRREMDIAFAAVEEARHRIIVANTSGTLSDPKAQEAIEAYADALWEVDSGEIGPALLDMLEKRADAAIRGIPEEEQWLVEPGRTEPSPTEPGRFAAQDIEELGAAERIREEGRIHLNAIRKALNLPSLGAKGTKPRVRLVTGQSKIGGLVREEAALKAGMRKAERAARLAQREGRKTGIRQEYERLKALDSQRREHKHNRERILQLAERIMRPVSSTVDFYHKEAIENFQEGLDPGFRLEKTLEQRRRTRAFLETSPKSVLKDMPVRLLRLLDKKALNDYTVEDLEELAAEVDRLRAMGRLKRQLTLEQERRDFEKTRNEIVSNVLRGKEYAFEAEPIVASTRKVGALRRGYRVSRAYTLRPSRIFDLLDGRKNFEGETHRFFYDRVNDLEDVKLKTTDARLDKGKAKLQELGLKLSDLAKTRKIDGVKYTVDEMIDVYVGFQNPRKKLAIMYGNGIDKALGAKIIAALTEKEKALGDFLIAEYEENYNRLREAHVELTNQDLGYEPNYTPMRRRGFDYRTMKAELADELLHRKNLRRGYVGRGFTIARQEIPAEYQKPIRLGAYATWLEQVPKQEQFIQLAKPVKALQKMVGDEHFRDVVRRNFGDEYIEAVESYVNRAADPNIYRAFEAAENGVRIMREHAAIAYLAFNLATMGKQLPSLAFYLGDAGPLHLLASLARFSAAPFRSIEFVTSRDPQMKHRSIERELEELKQQNSALYHRMLRKVGKKGMVGIYALDRVATTIGWRAVYEKNVNRVGEAEAIKLAQKATLRTQPAAHAKDVAQLYATNEFLNAFTQFTNQLNQIYNIITYDIPSDFRRGRFYRAFLSTLALAMGAIVIWMIRNRRMPEGSADLKEAVSEQFINSIPLVGRAITALSSGFSASELPFFRVVERGYRVFTAKEVEKKAKAALEAMAVFFGFPYVGPKRVIEAVTEGEAGRLLGGKARKKGSAFKGARRFPR